MERAMIDKAYKRGKEVAAHNQAMADKWYKQEHDNAAVQWYNQDSDNQDSAKRYAAREGKLDQAMADERYKGPFSTVAAQRQQYIANDRMERAMIDKAYKRGKEVAAHNQAT